MQISDKKLFRQACFVDGKWLHSRDNNHFSVNNPANGQVIGSVPDLDAESVRDCISSAAEAFENWRSITTKERGEYLNRWRDLMMQHIDDLACIMVAEQGKPLAEARGEISYAASFLEWFAEEGRRTYGETIPHPSPGKKIIVSKEPVGVVAAITPWNFPSAMLTRKAGAALAAGCTFIAKPAPETPFSALALAELADRAGIPQGVFNVITGDAITVGQEITSNSTVRKLSFTGSTAVGKLLIAQCADTVKKVSMELGGNSPFIVFDDADLDQAVEGAMLSKFRNTGQTCVCANRFYIHNNIFNQFSKKLVSATSKLIVGGGMNNDVNQGPLINHDAIIKVEEHIADALEKGAKIIIGGERHELGGTFFKPTVLVDANQDMKIAHEETFGPVAPLFRFDDEIQVVGLANDTESGLAAYVFTSDLNRSLRVAEKLEYGIVGINEGIISTEVAPFGGIKQSGIGREGSHYGIDEYMEVKYICVGGLSN